MNKRIQVLIITAVMALGAIGLVMTLTQCGNRSMLVTDTPMTKEPGVVEATIAASVTKSPNAGETAVIPTAEPSTAAGGTAPKDSTGQEEQQVVIVSLRREAYEQVADIPTVRSTFRLDPVWLVLTPENFEKLQATGVAFDRWPRVLVSLSQEAYEQVVHIPAVYTVDHGSLVWLELTPSNFVKLYTTGVAFTPEVKGILLRRSGYKFDPVTEDEPSFPPELTADYTAGVPSFHIVQVFGPPKDGWSEAIRDQGGEIVKGLYGYSYLVWMTPEQAARVDRLDFVRWVGPYHPAYRVAMAVLLDAAAGYGEVGIKNVAIAIYDAEVGGTAEGTIEAIEAMGGELVNRYESSPFVKTEFVLPGSALTPTAQLNNVERMSYSFPELTPEDEMSD